MSIIPLRPATQTNAFLLRGKEGAVLVDTGPPNCADRLLAQIRKHGIAPGDVRLILITHGHLDHFGSARPLRERTGAPVAVHARDADALREGVHQPESLRPTGWPMALLQRLPLPRGVSSQAPALEPDILLGGEFRLDEYGISGRVIPTPGHTPGSVSVILDTGEAIIGDVVMGQLMGLIHRPGPPLVAWDLERNRESLRALLALTPHTLYVGHGGPFRAEELIGLAGMERSKPDDL